VTAKIPWPELYNQLTFIVSILMNFFKFAKYYRVCQNSRIPNSECGREGPSGARKILRKKNSLFLKKIQGDSEISLEKKVKYP
jgi:hypothetical protein